MPNEVLIQDVAGSSLSSICVGVDASLNPADDGTNYTDDVGTDTCDFAITLASLANTTGRQSAKIDLGAVRGITFALFGCVDFTGETPLDAGSIDYYWAPSTNATAGIGNVAGNSGGDAACPDGATSTGITLAEFLQLCIPLGELPIFGQAGDAGTVQAGFVSVFASPTRYGQLIVVNNGGDVLEGDDAENHQVIRPIITEIQ